MFWSAFVEDLKYVAKTDDMFYKVTMAYVAIWRVWSLINRIPLSIEKRVFCTAVKKIRSELIACFDSLLPTVNEVLDLDVS